MESDVWLDVPLPLASAEGDYQGRQLREQLHRSADALKMFADSAMFYLLQHCDKSPVQIHQISDAAGVVSVYCDGEPVFQTWIDEGTTYGDARVRVHAKWLKDMDDE